MDQDPEIVCPSFSEAGLCCPVLLPFFSLFHGCVTKEESDGTDVKNVENVERGYAAAV